MRWLVWSRTGVTDSEAGGAEGVGLWPPWTLPSLAASHGVPQAAVAVPARHWLSLASFQVARAGALAVGQPEGRTGSHVTQRLPVSAEVVA